MVFADIPSFAPRTVRAGDARLAISAQRPAVGSEHGAAVVRFSARSRIVSEPFPDSRSAARATDAAGELSRFRRRVDAAADARVDVSDVALPGKLFAAVDVVVGHVRPHHGGMPSLLPG